MRLLHAMRLAVPLLVSLGCRERAPGTASDTARDTARAPMPGDSLPARAVSLPGDSLRFTLIVPPEVRAGGRAALTVRLENTSARPLTLYLRGREITFDVLAAASDGREVWRLLEDDVIPAVVQLVALAPGETLERQADWDLRTKRGAAPPGEYVLHARLLTEGDPLATPTVGLRIVPR